MAHVRNIRTNLRAEIIKVDPDIDYREQNHIEYKMSNGRVFTGRPGTRGAYAPEEE